MIKCKFLSKNMMMLIYLQLEKRTLRKLLKKLKNRNFSSIHSKCFEDLSAFRELFVFIDDMDHVNIFEIIKNQKNIALLLNFFNKIKILKINLPFKIGFKLSKVFNTTIVNCSILTSLTLCFGYYYNDFDGMKIISELLKSAKNIINFKLYLNSNKISDNSIKMLSHSLANMTNIKDLLIKLDINKISDLGCISLSESFSLMSKLSNLKLNLNYNNIGIDAFNILVDSIFQLQNLNSLELHIVSNKIKEKDILQLSQRIKQISQNLFKIEFKF